jgi:hypothetical protein
MRIRFFTFAILFFTPLSLAQQTSPPSPPPAQETATLIQYAPCEWFVRVYPDTWGTDHIILVNKKLEVGKISFGRGLFRMDDGTDVYDYLEKKCGGK